MNDKEKLSCLTDRPCTACKFIKEEGCSKWSCIFEEKSGVSEREKETDLISRKSAQAKIKKICEKYGYTYDDSGVFEWGTSSKAWGHALDDLPTYSVPEREKETDIEGEWRTDKQGFTYCTLCKFKKIQNDGRSYKFCPWCGKPMITAYMRGGSVI